MNIGTGSVKVSITFRLFDSYIAVNNQYVSAFVSYMVFMSIGYNGFLAIFLSRSGFQFFHTWRPAAALQQPDGHYFPSWQLVRKVRCKRGDVGPQRSVAVVKGIAFGSNVTTNQQFWRARLCRLATRVAQF